MSDRVRISLLHDGELLVNHEVDCRSMEKAREFFEEIMQEYFKILKRRAIKLD